MPIGEARLVESEQQRTVLRVGVVVPAEAVVAECQSSNCSDRDQRYGGCNIEGACSRSPLQPDGHEGPGLSFCARFRSSAAGPESGRAILAMPTRRSSRPRHLIACSYISAT